MCGGHFYTIIYLVFNDFINTNINVWYLFIKYQVGSGEVTIKNCPMDYMVGFYFGKPLQGSKFCKFGATIMNMPEDTTNCEIEYIYLKMRN